MIVETAPAKINLALHVRRRRADGYHDLETLFAFARDGDTVAMTPADRWSLTVTGPQAAGLASGSRWDAGNLVVRAADAFSGTFAVPPQAITLDKHLPVASGIGGGSADAAATLRLLARLASVPLDDPNLVAIARGLGADVPACLFGQTSLGTGAGEVLEPLRGLAGTPLLLVNPGVAVSTAAVFRGWDGVDGGAIVDGDLLTRARLGRNDLAPAARTLAPAIAEVEAMLDQAPGVLLSRMSGSGATCFALFADEASRDRTARVAANQGWWTMATRIA